MFATNILVPAWIGQLVGEMLSQEISVVGERTATRWTIRHLTSTPARQLKLRTLLYTERYMIDASSQDAYSYVAYSMNYAESINSNKSVGNCIMRSILIRTLHHILSG